MSEKQVDHVALNGRRLRRMKAGLDKMIRSARDSHWRAEIHFYSGNLDGGKMRNLDDLVDASGGRQKEIREYLRRVP